MKMEKSLSAPPVKNHGSKEHLLPELIDEEQTAFIKGKQTQDNISRTVQLIDKLIN